MVISSRTPEGDSNRCAVCGNDTRTEPSTVPVRDAPCPHCGSLIWFTESRKNSVASRGDSIERLANEIVHLSELKLAPPEYYGEFLQRLLAATAARAGAVWLRTPKGNLQLQYQIDMRQAGLDITEDSRQLHDELLRCAVMNGKPICVPPQSTFGSSKSGQIAAGNPTAYVILIAPILYDQQVVGLVETWQRLPCGLEVHL